MYIIKRAVSLDKDRVFAGFDHLGDAVWSEPFFAFQARVFTSRVEVREVSRQLELEFSNCRIVQLVEKCLLK